jgi:multicomponent Na+:H+ antiporter subunit C
MFEDGTIINELFFERLNYLIYVILLLIGLHAMISKNNLIKKLIGMSVFQTAIILFYVSIAVKEDATIPIYLPEHDPHGSHAAHAEGNRTEQASHGPVVLNAGLVKGYANPLPHVLMLTAIVVGVATLGLALALCLRIYQGYGTIEEDEVLAKIEKQAIRSPFSGIPPVKNKNLAKEKEATARPKTATNKPKASDISARKQNKPTSKAISSSTNSRASSSKKKLVQTKSKSAKPKSSSSVKTNAVTKAKPKVSAKKTGGTQAKPRTPRK